jgi:aminoglycoside phosphotransferase (APT) family kinase protein
LKPPAQPERVIAAGRASEILDLGRGRVLRRFKNGGDPEREAGVMAHARAHGFPVPEVLEVRDDALVLQRIDGPSMLRMLRTRPWRVGAYARMLAGLHSQLHEIPFKGERLLHVDLHPDNVLLARDGPVVIDWTNSRAGDPRFDVAMTWVICVTSGGPGERLFTRLFLRHAGRDEARHALADAAAYRLADVNVTDAERERVRRLVRSELGLDM